MFITFVSDNFLTVYQEAKGVNNGRKYYALS